MRNVKIVCKCGYSWKTNINGTNEEIEKYFLRNVFNVGAGEHDKIVQPIKVIFQD